MHKLQQKIYKAYGKVASVLGEDFDVYRAQYVTNPIQEANWLDTRKVSFSLNDKYTTTPSAGLNQWNCYMDGRLETLFDIQQGDLLKNHETGEVWMIASAEVMLPIKAIRLPNTFSVNRVSYEGGSGPADSAVFTDVPCYVEPVSSSEMSAGFIPANNYGSDSVPSAIIWCVDKRNEIEVRDALVLNDGQRFQVLSALSTEFGKKLVVKAYDAS